MERIIIEIKIDSETGERRERALRAMKTIGHAVDDEFFDNEEGEDGSWHDEWEDEEIVIRTHKELTLGGLMRLAKEIGLDPELLRIRSEQWMEVAYAYGEEEDFFDNEEEEGEEE